MAKTYIATVDNPTTAVAGQILKKTATGSEWVSIDTTLSDSPNAISNSAVNSAIANKQDKLTAGDNITIENNVISAQAVYENYASISYVDEQIAVAIGEALEAEY